MDNLIDMARYAENIVKNESRLELQFPRQSFTVCFRYKPRSGADVDAFNLSLREALRRSGKALVNYGHLGKELTIRLVIANAEIERKDVDLFFENLLNTASVLENSTAEVKTVLNS